MDESRFDELVKRLAQGRSRRGALKAIAGGAGSAVAIAVGVGNAAAAKKRPVGGPCRLDRDCASNRCVGESKGHKICHCGTALDCPIPADLCQEVTCLADGTCAGRPITCPACQECSEGECVSSFEGQSCTTDSGAGILHGMCCGGACDLSWISCNSDSGCCAGSCAGLNVKGQGYCCPFGMKPDCTYGCCGPDDICVPFHNGYSDQTYCCPPDSPMACTTGCCRPEETCVPLQEPNSIESACCPPGATQYCTSGCCRGACDRAGNCVPG